MKRVFDMMICLVILPPLLPWMILLALIIKLDSNGPVLFMQKRVGRYGQIFSVIKFRSMIIDAENIGPYFTVGNDSRVTKFGRFIRKTSLDELPQLFNVLRGEMSLVGPRPNVEVQKANYTEVEWQKRNSVRPGITGLAQATLRSAATSEERTRLDLEYVEKSSLFYDITIIILTIKQIFFIKTN